MLTRLLKCIVMTTNVLIALSNYKMVRYFVNLALESGTA